jgi:hypothetical protein
MNERRTKGQTMNFKAISLFVCCLENPNPVFPPQPPPPPQLHPPCVLTLTREVDIFTQNQSTRMHTHTKTQPPLFFSPKKNIPPLNVMTSL